MPRTCWPSSTRRPTYSSACSAFGRRRASPADFLPAADIYETDDEVMIEVDAPGVQPDDQVIVNPPDSVVDGQQVQIVQATLPGDAK